MSCVNCQCDQPCCFDFCDIRQLSPICAGCKVPVVLAPNLTLYRGAPLARQADGRYTLFDPQVTPPQRFVGIVGHDWQTDANGNGIVRSCYPNCGFATADMYISGTFRISDLDVTVDQLNAIIAQGAGRVIGDVNTLSGLLHLY